MKIGLFCNLIGGKQVGLGLPFRRASIISRESQRSFPEVEPGPYSYIPAGTTVCGVAFTIDTIIDILRIVADMLGIVRNVDPHCIFYQTNAELFIGRIITLPVLLGCLVSVYPDPKIVPVRLQIAAGAYLRGDVGYLNTGDPGGKVQAADPFGCVNKSLIT